MDLFNPVQLHAVCNSVVKMQIAILKRRHARKMSMDVNLIRVINLHSQPRCYLSGRAVEILQMQVIIMVDDNSLKHRLVKLNCPSVLLL